jgi:hypothetical protein
MTLLSRLTTFLLAIVAFAFALAWHDRTVRVDALRGQLEHAADSAGKVFGRRTDSLTTALVAAKSDLHAAEAEYTTLAARFRRKPRTVFDTTLVELPPDTVTVPVEVVRTIVEKADSTIAKCETALSVCEAGQRARDSTIATWQLRWDVRPHPTPRWQRWGERLGIAAASFWLGSR